MDSIKNERFDSTDFISFKFGELNVGIGNKFNWQGFIINEDGFEMSLGPEFDDEFVSLDFGDKAYYMGSTVSNKKFVFEVQLVEITKGELKLFMRELRARKVDVLSFGFNENYGYMAKLSDVSTMEYDPIRKCEGSYETLFNVKIPLSFTTVGNSQAEWIRKEEDGWLEINKNGVVTKKNLVDNDMGEEAIRINGNTITLYNYHAVDNFIEIKSSTGFKLNKNGIIYESNVPNSGILRVNFEYGVEFDDDGFVGSGKNYNLWIVPANNSLNFTVDRKGGSFDIKMTARDIL